MSKTTNRLVLFLAMLGLITSMYLTYSKLSGIPVRCSILSGCQTVEKSKYAVMFGIPVAFFGVLFYLSLIIATFLRTNEKYQQVITKLIFFATIVGFVFSIYLTYLELFVILAICIYCVISALTSTALFFIGLYENIIIRNNKI